MGSFELPCVGFSSRLMHLFTFGAFNFDKIQITSSLMSVFGVCVFCFFFPSELYVFR